MINFTQIISSIKSALPSTAPRRIVSIHLGSHSIKGIVAKRSGKKATIISSAETEIDTGGIHDLSMVGRALSTVLNTLETDVKQAVIVTDRVKFLAGELAIPLGAKLSDEKLSAAVAWEIEPYLDFPAQAGLFDYRLDNKVSPGADTTRVLISAMSKKEFDEITGVLKDFRMSFRHAYSPESALAFSSWIRDSEKSRIAVNCRHETLTGIYLKRSEAPFLIQSFPLEPDVLLEDQITAMVQEFSASSGNPDEVVIAGSAACEELAENLKSGLDINCRIWSPEKDLEEYGVTIRTDGLNQGYATVTGASLQELGFSEKPVAVTGRVPLIKQIRERAYLTPAVALIIIALFFAGHYAVVKYRTNHFTSRISVLEKKKSMLTQVRDERVNLQSRQSKAYQKKEYLEKLLPARQKNLLFLLTHIPEVIPDDMILDELMQKEAASFSVNGFTLHTGSVGIFAGRLLKLDICKNITVKSITKQDVNGETDYFPYEFCMELVLKE